jgi:hypothetical protein
MTSVVNTNMFPVYSEVCAYLSQFSYWCSIILFQVKDMTTVNSNIHAPLDGEFFGRPTRQTSQRFGVIGTGRPSGRVIPHFPSPISTMSPTDFLYPSFEAVHKAEIDGEVLQEKLNTTLSSRISSPPKVTTAPTDDVCSNNEGFDENQPPALSFRDALDSDSSSDIVPPPASRVNRKPFNVLFVERQSTRRFSQESGYTNSPPYEPARLVILEPKPRLAWHTTYEQLVSASKEASGNWSTTIKTDMPGGLARIRARAPQHIDLWLANKPDEPLDRMLAPVKGGSDRPSFPGAPVMKNVPLPEPTLSGDQPLAVPITPRRQVLLDMLNYRPTRVYL